MPSNTAIQDRRAEELLNDFLGLNVKRGKLRTPKHLERKVEPVYFDADRFRWYFHKREGRTIQQWRDAIDQEMRDAQA